MKTFNTKVPMRKRILECCILLELENKPMYVNDIIENIKKSKINHVEGATDPMLTQLKSKGHQGNELEDSIQLTPNKVHLLWLWSGYLNTTGI